MLNIWKNKKNFFAYNPSDGFLDKEKERNIIGYKEKDKIQDKEDYREYKNTVFYPSNKE